MFQVKYVQENVPWENPILRDKNFVDGGVTPVGLKFSNTK